MLDLVNKAPWSTLHLSTLLFILFSYSYVVYLLIYLVYIFVCRRVLLTCVQIRITAQKDCVSWAQFTHPTLLFTPISPFQWPRNFILDLGQENCPKKGSTIINHKEYLTVKLLIKMNTIINIKIKLNIKEQKYN